jgi:hypothetical protein
MHVYQVLLLWEFTEFLEPNNLSIPIKYLRTAEDSAQRHGTSVRDHRAERRHLLFTAREPAACPLLLQSAFAYCSHKRDYR